MRSTLRTVLLCFACAIAIGAAAPGNSLAARWETGGKILEKSTETALVGDEAGTIKIIAVNLTEVTCRVEYLSRLKGGSPGTGEFTYFVLSGCTDSTRFCSVSETKAERLSYPTELSESGGKFLDLVRSLAIAFKLAGASCTIAGSYVLEEEAQGEFDNLTQTLVFPSTALPGTFLVINDLTTLHGYGGKLEGSLPVPGMEVVK
jgi:hypothetical protein